MKKFKAEIDVMPLEALLDPQGKAVTHALQNLELAAVSGVRVGKHITLLVEARDLRSAEGMVDDACRKLLCNQVMEQYRFRVEPA